MTVQLSLQDLVAPSWRPPAPALAGPGWSIPDHALNTYQPRYHTRAIRAAVPLIEQHYGDRLAYEAYLDAAADDRRPYQHHRALWARKQRLQNRRSR